MIDSPSIEGATLRAASNVASITGLAMRAASVPPASIAGAAWLVALDRLDLDDDNEEPVE